MQICTIFVAFLLSLVFWKDCSAELQKYAVKGRLMCGNRPATGIKVKLIDIDIGGPDDDMDEKRTDSNGNFVLSGQTSEMTNIDPMVKIYHNCLDSFAIRHRRWRMKMPQKYIGHGKNSQPTMVDLGVINLEPSLMAEDRNF